MARITVEDCLQKVNNRFSLIHMASKRVRELRKGADPTISSKNRDIVIALREIAAGNIVMAPEGKAELLPGDDFDLLPEELSEQPELVYEAAAEKEEIYDDDDDTNDMQDTEDMEDIEDIEDMEDIEDNEDNEVD